MNMNNTPTIDQLKKLFAEKDDQAGDHLLWVDTDGNVYLELMSSSPTAFEGASKMGNVQFRGGRFHEGNKLVGPEAAQSEQFIQRVFDRLVQYWAEKRTGIQDII